MKMLQRKTDNSACFSGFQLTVLAINRETA
jgi:hypothetical protein